MEAKSVANIVFMDVFSLLPAGVASCFYVTVLVYKTVMKAVFSDSETF